MRAVVEQQRAALAAGELDAFVDLDREFHRVAVAATGNAILVRSTTGFGIVSRRPSETTHPAPATSSPSTRRCSPTLEAGKQSRLIKLLADHLRGTRAALLGVEDTAPAGTPPRGPAAARSVSPLRRSPG